ncbi:MAG: hypothetical protein P4L99_01380 [Chthoniobacter sp.]|nr:hypothetical protein [Chthoniobacter sp.]
MATLTATEKIRKILADAQAEADKLKAEAMAELKEKLKAAQNVARSIEMEIEELTGKAPKAGKRFGGVIGNAKNSFADSKELKALLAKADGKKLNRKGFNDAGYSLKSALQIAKADKATFGHEQNGPQGSVWLK